MRFLRNLWKETQGQDLIEYALAAGLVAVAAVAAMGGLGTAISTGFSKVGSMVTSAIP